MAKYYGTIGYVKTEETTPGVWEPQEPIERQYYIEFIRNTSKFQSSGDVNDDVNVSNEISIIADPYAMENFLNITYIEYMGTRWKITSKEIKYPKLILTIGGVYNG